MDIFGYILTENIENVREWCKTNNVNSVYHKGELPLYCACKDLIYSHYNNIAQSPTFKIIKILLENGANPNEFTINTHRDSVMHLVSEDEHFHIDLLKLLIDYGGNIYLGHPSDNRSTPLYYIGQYDLVNGTSLADDIEKYYRDHHSLDIKEPCVE